nr:hypothetical protein [uncultured Albidiferax sp.]
MNIALTYSASPVLIALGSVLWLHERMRWSQALGVAIALTGVLHGIMKGEWAALGQVQFVVGDAWIVAAMVSWALYALLQKIWPSTLGSTARLAAICWGAMPVLLVGTAWEMAQPGSPRLGTAALVLGAALILPGVFLVSRSVGRSPG